MEQRNWLINLRGRLTQEKVAFLSGISRGSYSNIETGKRDPSVSMAKKIAKALGFNWQLFFDQKCFVSKQVRSSKKSA